MKPTTDRRAAIKLLMAAPAGIALSVANLHEAEAQAEDGTFAVRATTAPNEPLADSPKIRQSNSERAVRSVAGQAATDAAVINHWNATAVNVIVTDAMTGAAEAMLYLGFVQAAVYDAVMGITHRYSAYKPSASPRPLASPQAAAAAAAHRVLMTYFGHVPAAVSRLTDAYANSISALPNDPATTAGLQYGRQTAEHFVALRADDGRYGPNIFENAPATGIWRPTPPANAPMFGKFLCETTPLMIDSSSQFRPGPPPDMASAEYAAAFEEVKAFGAKEGSARTPFQTETALFISSLPPVPLHAGLRDLADRREMDISDRARLFAAVSMSVADAIICCWDAKVHYGFWRPITAIRLADEDGNPATTADPAWDSLIPNPAYPDYTSGLNAAMSSATHALERVLGTDRIDLTLSSPVTNTTRTYEFGEQLRNECVDGRLASGVHFRFANVAAREQGKQVANWALDRYFQPM
jgi:hypothetical protein